MSNVAFGRLLKERRRAQDLTQERLAELAGCAAVTLKKIEAGSLRPSRQIAERLAEALGVPPDQRTAFIDQARGTADSPPTPPDAHTEIAAETPNGRTVRSYELRERIGVGGFGVVYRAVQSAVGRDVAIKVIHPQYADQPTFIRRFEVEAQLVARLEHPHIVPLYDYWREPGSAYLVMRYLRGGNLSDAVRRGSWTPTATVRLLDQIGAALHAAHRQGVVHRDVKPANILLDAEGNAYLADFGIAKDLDRAGDRGTQPGAVVGSPEYLSPEQLRDEPVTPQTDVYSLGLVLYELLSGANPFAGLSPAQRLHRQLHEPLPSLRALRPDLADVFDAVIARATAKHGAERYIDVPNLVADVRQAVHSDPPAIPLHDRQTVDMPAQAAAGGPLSPELTVTSAVVNTIENPYKGLRSFQESDVHAFFGREALTQRLLARMSERSSNVLLTDGTSGQAWIADRFLAVIGPSGSGKSSAVLAGLLPALRRGAVAGSEHWFIAEAVPGANPLEEIEAALLRVAVNPPPSLLEQLRADERGLARAIKRALPADERVELVLVLDQFEEVFTLVAHEDDRAHLLRSLFVAVTEPRARLRVLITLRADFYDRPLLYSDFSELLRLRTEVVTPLTTDELQRAITRPAERAGVTVEPTLVAAMTRDVEAQPGALPLMQYALTELFDQRDGKVMTLAHYQALGGIAGVLAQRADALYLALNEDGQWDVQQLFLRLLTPGEGAEDTRRRTRRSELADADISETVVEAFGRARLLTFDHDPISRESTAEVAHEALLRAWPRLRGWIDVAREDLLIQRRLAQATQEWVRAGRDPSYLASGARLAQYEALDASGTINLTAEEQAFLEAGLAEQAAQAAAEQERLARELAQARVTAAAQHSAAQRLRVLVGALVLFLLAAAALSGFALQQRGIAAANAETAQANFTRAEAQRLASRANQMLLEYGNSEVIALLALRSLRLQYTAEGDAAIAGVARQPLPILELRGHTGTVRAIAYTPDGTAAISAGDDLTARMWDLKTGQEIRRFLGNKTDIYDLEISADGQQLATASIDEAVVRLYRIDTGALLQELRGHTRPLRAVAFSPDNERVYSASTDKTLRVWDARTGALLRMLTADSELWVVAVSPDGRLVAAGTFDGRILLWDARTGTLVRTLTGHKDSVWNLAFSPDGARLASGSLDKTAHVWETATGAQLVVITAHTNFVNGVVFSPDGRFVLTGSQDRTARLWDAATGAQLMLFNGHTNLIWDVAYAPDGRSILTTGFDQTVKLWRLPEHPETPTFTGHTSSVRNAVYIPDGKTILSVSYDGTARIWDVNTGRALRTLAGDGSGIEGLGMSPDGRYVVTGDSAGTARLWDTKSGAALRKYAPSAAGVTSAAFAPDGARFATGSYDFTVRIFDQENAEERHVLRHDDAVFSVAFSPDGRSLLSGGFDHTARLWDTATGTQLKLLRVPPNTPSDAEASGDGAASVAFTPDGRTVATGSWSGPIWLWDVQNGTVLRQLPGHSAFVWSVAFSRDGTLLLSAGADGTARLWDVASGRELRRFAGHTGTVYSASFAPDGRSIVTGADDGRLLIWDVQISDTVTTLCGRLLRDLNDDERAQYGISDTTPTCAVKNDV